MERVVRHIKSFGYIWLCTTELKLSTIIPSYPQYYTLYNIYLSTYLSTYQQIIHKDIHNAICNIV